MAANPGFPLVLDVKGWTVLVIGGDEEAALSRFRALLPEGTSQREGHRIRLRNYRDEVYAYSDAPGADLPDGRNAFARRGVPSCAVGGCGAARMVGPLEGIRGQDRAVSLLLRYLSPWGRQA